MKRRASRLLALLSLLQAGCLQELIEQVVTVAAPDGRPFTLDMRSDGDLGDPDLLSLTGAKPNHGPFSGGTQVILSGSGFRPGLKVSVGRRPVHQAHIEVMSPFSAAITAPPGAVGPADIEVERGGHRGILPRGFRYDGVVFDPSSGPTAGGTLITLLGSGTAFTEGMILELGGEPMTEVEVLSSTRLRARTPGGALGPAALRFGKADRVQVIDGAFTYYDSTDPMSGGMGGGPIKGTLTVSALNSANRSPLPGVTIVVQRSRGLEKSGKTDASGVFVLSAVDLRGPVTVTGALTGFETSTIASFDARDLTILLKPLAQPQPGPMPPGTLSGAIKGHVLFGGTTGAGTPSWKLVPEPKPGQERRIHVHAAAPSISWGPPSPSPSATISFKADGKLAWPYTIVGRTGGMAIYAVAGIHDTQTGQFEAYAMGVTRGVLVGPGETITADVWINIPLAEKVTVAVKDLPPLAGKHLLTLGLDLGADGLILSPSWEIRGDGDLSSKTFGRLPPLVASGLADATYTIDLTLESATSDGLPLSRATARGIVPSSGQLTLDQLMGFPVQVKPQPGAQITGNTLSWAVSGGAPGLAVTVIRRPDETPVWRIISPGGASRVQLPDPATFGLPPWPTGPLVWLHWLARIPGFDYNSFTYRHLSSSYWDRWSFDELGFKGP